MPLAYDVAANVTNLINEQITEPPGIQAHLCYRWSLALENLSSTPVVLVVPGSTATEQISRFHSLETVTVTVAVAAKFADTDQLMLARLLDICEATDLLLRRKEFNTNPPVAWQKTEYLMDSGFDDKLLDQHKIFVSTMRFTFITGRFGTG